MSQKIGQKEQALRDMRAGSGVTKTREAVVASLPVTSGRRPIKRKRKAKK